MSDDVFDEFRRIADDEKIEAFEESTLKLILRQLGAPKIAIDSASRDLGPAFTMSWFNEQAFIDDNVMATRIFKFNLGEVLSKPARHPITEEFFKQLEVSKVESPTDFIMVFKCVVHGRMIATTKQVALPHARIILADGREPYSICLMSNFFSHHYGLPMADMDILS